MEETELQPKAITAEDHAAALETPDWLFAATKAFHRWPAGKELSEADYKAAVEKAAGSKMRGSLEEPKK